MKPILTTFLDYENASLSTQLELFKKLNLSHYIVRKIDGKAIIDITDELISTYVQTLKNIKVRAVDPLLESVELDSDEQQNIYQVKLEETIKKVKLFKPNYYIYTIPKFDEQNFDQKKLIEVVKNHIHIIKRHKLKIFIKFSDQHTPKVYRYIFEALKDKSVEVIFDYVYLYRINEAEVTAYRILRNYIGMLIMEDIDKMGYGRVIGSSENIAVSEIAKRFIKRKFDGLVVLDSSLVEQLQRANQKNWLSKLVSKKAKLEIKIYEDFMERYRSTDIFRILRIQMAVLSLMFLNQKVALG